MLRDLPHRYGRRIPDGLLFGMRRVRPPEIDPFIQALERADAEHSLGATFDDFDRIIITFSGGKDSMATLLYLLEMGVPREQIELQHQEIDEPGVPFMDWPCTPAYCSLIARAFGIPIYFSGRVGGFLRELDRVDAPQAPIYFESPGGKYIVGGEGPKNTRGMFPAATANLKFRWCSSQLKIEVGRAIFRHDPRFARGRFLYISGQRAEESISRAKQAPVEIDPTTTQHRYVLRWKPVFTWDEAKVWDIIERWRVRPHPGYRLGFSRLSCMTCFTGETEVITRDGIKPIKSLVGSEPRLLVPKKTAFGISSHATFRAAEVRSFGHQRIWELTVKRDRFTKVIRTTASHRWFVSRKDGRRHWSRTVEATTDVLTSGDRVRHAHAMPLPEKAVEVRFATARGFVFGDGTRGCGERPGLAYFFPPKDDVMLPYFDGYPVVQVDGGGGRAPCLSINGMPKYWKDLPPLDESRSFLLSWLAGYFAADGCVSRAGQARMDSASESAIRFVQDVASICGIRHGGVRSVMRKGRGKRRSRLWNLTLSPLDVPLWFFKNEHHRAYVEARRLRGEKRDSRWVVQSARATDDVEEVFCAVVPGVEAFVLADNVLTGNCIFADANQWATVRHMAPAFFDRVSRREAMAPRAIKALKRQKTTGGVIETYRALNEKTGKMTTRRRRIGGTKRVWYIDVPISEQADKGCSFLPKTPGTMALVKKALSVKYKEDLILGPRETWQLPLGAFKKQGGPS